MFWKPFIQLTVEDIQQLITDKTPENNQLEYKGELSTKNHGTDPWMSGKEKIGDKARNELLEELVAFANAHGGILILGIQESKEGRGLPDNINPIPRCEELVKPLELQIRDCIEPPIHTIQVKALQTNLDGSGVVLFKVEKSRSAPHRLKPTKECYIRRNDRSEKMSMIEIQDCTLLIDKGMARVEAEFKKQQSLYQHKILNFQQGKSTFFGIRATIVPVYADIYIECNDFFKQNFQFPRVLQIIASLDGSEFPFKYDFNRAMPTPILRGVRFQERVSQIQFTAELFCDGVAQVSQLFAPDRPNEDALYPCYFFGTVINIMLLAHQYKVSSGFTDIEYGLELEISRGKGNGPLRLCGFNQSWGQQLGTFSDPVLFPRYSILDQQYYDQLLTSIYRDVFNAVGKRNDSSFTFNWPG